MSSEFASHAILTFFSHPHFVYVLAVDMVPLAFRILFVRLALPICVLSVVGGKQL